MKKQMFAVAMSAWMVAASPYDSSSGPLVVTGAMMTPVSGGTATTLSGTGPSWSLNVANEGWSEGYAYVTFEVAPNTRVQITRGTLQNTITDGGQGWYWGDLVLFASAADPAGAIAGKVAGPTGSDPAAGVMAWVSDSQYDLAGYATATKAAVNSAGYRYYGGNNGYGSYLAAIMGYSANVENFKDGGLDITGGAFVGWNEVSATSMASGTQARPLTDILYPAGGGLNRPLKDQTCAFDGTVLTGASRTYVTLLLRGGGGGGGSIHVNNLTLSFSSPDYLPITGAMMTAVPGNTDATTTLTGTGSSWSLDVTSVYGWSEGYAYTTFMVGPNTRVQLTSGTLQNTILPTDGWYWGDVVMFASPVNPSSAIAGKVPGPTGSDPAPGVMAWVNDATYDANGFGSMTKAALNALGYRYNGGWNGSFNTYLDAILGYSANVENFRDGGLDITGGAYVGWNESSATSMLNGAPARRLTDILYPAGGGKNRPLKDQTYAFDGTVTTGVDGNTFVTVIVRGGGGGGGSILVNNLGVSLSPANTLKVTGPMMTAVKSSGTSATVNGSGANWSLNLVGSGEAEGYAYTTFVVGPHTKVQISDGSVSNTVGGATWRYGDLVIFASAANPSAAIAGKVNGPVVPAANPAPGVMAYITGPQYKAAGYRTTYRAKELVNNAGYRYYENDGTCGSYLAAISQYSSNVENFQDGGLDINGGAYVGWSAAANTFMFNTPAAAHALTDVLYPAWGGLNRALRDQTYDFDGAVYTGASNMFVTVMLRGGGDSNGGAIALSDLTLTFTSPGYLPPLDLAQEGDNFLFSWPGNAPGLVVEQTDALAGSNTVWTTVTGTPVLESGRWTMQRPAEAGARFFRLRMK